MRAARVVAIVACWAAVASAEPTSDDDKRLFDAAVEDESADRWAAARDKLLRVVARRETAGVRFHLGHASEKVGEPCAAIVQFDRAAELAADDAALRVRARKRAELARSATARVRVVTNPDGASVSVDDVTLKRAGDCLSPGQHRIVAHAAGHTVLQRVVELAPGSETTVTLTLVPDAPPRELTPAPLPPAPPRDDSGRWWVLGAGAVFGVASAALFYEHARLERETSRVCATQCDRASRDRAASRTQTGAISAGAGALIAGGVFVALTVSR